MWVIEVNDIFSIDILRMMVSGRLLLWTSK